MVKRRNVLLLLAGAAVFMVTVVCGSSSMSAAPQPTADLSQPSGGGAEAAPTAAAAAPTVVSAETELPLIILPTATEQESSPSAPMAVPAAIPETRRLTLEYPPHIRAGDADVVRLTLEVNALGGIVPTAEIQGNLVTGQTVQIPNLYDTHNVIAEARLDLAGVDIRPGDDISEPLLPGQPVTFYWSVHPAEPGTYRGTVWLFLRFIDKATQAESRSAISAQTLQISTTDFLGLNGGLARIAGGVGSFFGAVLGFPFVDDVLKWIWRHLRGHA